MRRSILFAVRTKSDFGNVTQNLALLVTVEELADPSDRKGLEEDATGGRTGSRNPVL